MIDSAISRAMRRAVEPYHSVVYFAPEALKGYGAIGLKGYWMGYFASRAAPLGAVGPEIVMATFYNFAEWMVRRAIPDAWSYATPARVLEVRHEIALTATERLPGTDAEITQACELAEPAARAARAEGRVLFGAYSAMAWPDDPHLRLWHACTLLREHRGDTHNAVLIDEGIDGLEGHLLAAAAGMLDPVTQRKNRGISDEDWDAGIERLHARGLLGGDGSFTDEGRRAKERIERRTDELSAQPYEVLGEEGCARLVALMSSIIGSAEPIPFPNAMGLPR